MSTYRDEYPLPPSISQREAVERVRALTNYWGAQYGTSTEWVDTCGTICGRVLGLSFQARFQVEPQRMLGELKVSFLAVKMGGRQYLKRKLDHYLNPEISLEDLQAVVRQLSPASA